MQYNIHTAQQVQQLNTVNNMQTTQQTIRTALLAHGFALESSEIDNFDEVQRDVYAGNALVEVRVQLNALVTEYADVKFNITNVLVEVDTNSGEAGLIWARHTLDENDKLRLYGEDTVKAAMTKMFGVRMYFTESGMQDEHVMSLEVGED